MTEILTSNIQIEILMSDDKKERYILKKVWDTEKPIATIITLYPSTSDLIINDSTTTLLLITYLNVVLVDSIVLTYTLRFQREIGSLESKILKRMITIY